MGKARSNSFLYIYFKLPVFLNFLNPFMMFSKWSTSAISKSWLSQMQFGHKLFFSQKKNVNNFIHFKLVYSNIIKTNQLLNTA